MSSSSWTKWECPPDFLTVEEKLSSLQLTTQQLDELAMSYFDIELKRAKSAEERAAWATLKVKKKANIISKNIQEALVEDFQLWLQGRSKYSIKILEGKRVGDDGKLVEFSRECTPWGNKDLMHLEDVREWLTKPLLNRDKVAKAISILKLTSPMNIDECWIYYKYIVRAVGIDGDILKEQRNYNQFDYIEKRPMVMKGKEDKDGDRRVVPVPDERFNPLHIENPMMEKFDKEGYKHLLNDTMNRANNGDAGLLESDDFSSLNPEDKIYVATVLSEKVKIEPDLLVNKTLEYISEFVDTVMTESGISKTPTKATKKDPAKIKKEVDSMKKKIKDAKPDKAYKDLFKKTTDTMDKLVKSIKEGNADMKKTFIDTVTAMGSLKKVKEIMPVEREELEERNFVDYTRFDDDTGKLSDVLVTEPSGRSYNLSILFNDLLGGIDLDKPENAFTKVATEKYINDILHNVKKNSEEGKSALEAVFQGLDEYTPVEYMNNMLNELKEADAGSPLFHDIAVLYPANNIYSASNGIRSLSTLASDTENIAMVKGAVNDIMIELSTSEMNDHLGIKDKIVQRLHGFSERLEDTEFMNTLISKGLIRNEGEYVRSVLNSELVPNFAKNNRWIVPKGTSLYRSKLTDKLQDVDIVRDETDSSIYKMINAKTKKEIKSAKVTEKTAALYSQLGNLQKLLASSNPKIAETVVERLHSMNEQDIKGSDERRKAWVDYINSKVEIKPVPVYDMEMEKNKMTEYENTIAKTQEETQRLKQELSEKEEQIELIRNENVEGAQEKIDVLEEEKKQLAIQAQAFEQQQIQEQQKIAQLAGEAFSGIKPFIEMDDISGLSAAQDYELRNAFGKFSETNQMFQESGKFNLLDLATGFYNDKKDQALSRYDQIKEYISTTPEKRLTELNQEFDRYLKDENLDAETEFGSLGIIGDNPARIEIYNKARKGIIQNKKELAQTKNTTSMLEVIMERINNGMSNINDAEAIDKLKKEMSNILNEHSNDKYDKVINDTASTANKVLELLNIVNRSKHESAQLRSELEKLRLQNEEANKQLFAFNNPAPVMEEVLSEEDKIYRETNKIRNKFLERSTLFSKMRIDKNDIKTFQDLTVEKENINQLGHRANAAATKFKNESEQYLQELNIIKEGKAIDETGDGHIGLIDELSSKSINASFKGRSFIRTFEELKEIYNFYDTLIGNSMYHDPTSESDKSGLPALPYKEVDPDTRKTIEMQAGNILNEFNKALSENKGLLYSDDPTEKKTVSIIKENLLKLNSMMLDYSNQFTQNERAIHKAADMNFRQILEIEKLPKEERLRIYQSHKQDPSGFHKKEEVEDVEITEVAPEEDKGQTMTYSFPTDDPDIEEEKTSAAEFAISVSEKRTLTRYRNKYLKLVAAGHKDKDIDPKYVKAYNQYKDIYGSHAIRREPKSNRSSNKRKFEKPIEVNKQKVEEPVEQIEQALEKINPKKEQALDIVLQYAEAPPVHLSNILQLEWKRNEILTEGVSEVSDLEYRFDPKPFNKFEEEKKKLEEIKQELTFEHLVKTEEGELKGSAGYKQFLERVNIQREKMEVIAEEEEKQYLEKKAIDESENRLFPIISESLNNPGNKNDVFKELITPAMREYQRIQETHQNIYKHDTENIKEVTPEKIKLADPKTLNTIKQVNDSVNKKIDINSVDDMKVLDTMDTLIRHGEIENRMLLSKGEEDTIYGMPKYIYEDYLSIGQLNSKVANMLDKGYEVMAWIIKETDGHYNKRFDPAVYYQRIYEGIEIGTGEYISTINQMVTGDYMPTSLKDINDQMESKAQNMLAYTKLKTEREDLLKRLSTYKDMINVLQESYLEELYPDTGTEYIFSASKYLNDLMLNTVYDVVAYNSKITEIDQTRNIIVQDQERTSIENRTAKQIERNNPLLGSNKRVRRDEYNESNVRTFSRKEHKMASKGEKYVPKEKSNKPGEEGKESKNLGKRIRRS